MCEVEADCINAAAFLMISDNCVNSLDVGPALACPWGKRKLVGHLSMGVLAGEEVDDVIQDGLDYFKTFAYAFGRAGKIYY